MATDEPRHVVVNRANWESRVPLHEQGYGLHRYRDDPAFLSGVVRFDRPRLGDVADLDTVHLQCHIGTDTLSLHRLGARATGLDFSPSALAVARRLAAECGAAIDYVESELYGAVGALGAERFDLVYTGIGALCWLPDIAGWARVVAGLLRPGGRLFIREAHPVLWALCDPRPDRLLVLEYPYFETEGVPFSETTTYVEADEPVASPDIVHFNHGLGEIVGALLRAGMRIDGLDEHRSVPYDPFEDGTFAVDPSTEEYSMVDGPERLPLSYTLQATRTG